MTKDESLKISAEIASMINGGDLVIDYTESELEAAKMGIPEISLEGYQHSGLLGDFRIDNNEFEKFFVIKKLCDKLDIWRRADDRYLKELFGRAQGFDVRVGPERHADRAVGRHYATSARKRKNMGHLVKLGLLSAANKKGKATLPCFTSSRGLTDTRTSPCLISNRTLKGRVQWWQGSRKSALFTMPGKQWQRRRIRLVKLGSPTWPKVRGEVKR